MSRLSILQSPILSVQRTITSRSEQSNRLKVLYRYATIAILVLLFCRAAFTVSTSFGKNWDFANFFNTGARAFHGENATLYTTDAPIAGKPAYGDGFVGYAGFPLSAYVFAPLAVFSPRLALLIFKSACALFFAIGLYLLYPYWRELMAPSLAPGQVPLLYLLLILLFEPFWFSFNVGGQATPVAFLLLVLFLAACRANRFWAAALFLSIATLVKPFLILTAAALILSADWRFIKKLALCLLIEGMISLALFGLPIHIEFIRIMLQEYSRWAVPWTKNAALLGFIGNFWLYGKGLPLGLTPTPPVFAAMQIVFKVGVLVLFYWLFRTVRQAKLGTEEKSSRFAILAILFPLFFSNVVWAHYLAFLFIPAVFIVAKFHHLNRAAKILVLLMLLSTVRANWWPLTQSLQFSFTVNTVPEIVLAGLYGSGTLILLLILMSYQRELLFSSNRE